MVYVIYRLLICCICDPKVREGQVIKSAFSKIWKQKSWVRLYWPGYWRMPIHGRYPTTAERGDSCLLRFRPGPVRPSLDNLMSLASAELAILTPGLVRTPDRHSAAISSTPDLKPSTNSSFPVAGLQECATTPSWEVQALQAYLSVTGPVPFPVPMPQIMQEPYNRGNCISDMSGASMICVWNLVNE